MLFPLGRTELVRLPQWRSDKRRLEWYVFPGVTRPRLLVPTRPRGAWAMLERSDQGTRHPVLSSLLTRGARWRLLGLLPLTRLHVYPETSHQTVEAHLSGILGRPVRVGLRLGRARPHRAIVLQVFGSDGSTLAFVKAGATPESVSALAVEHRNLLQAQDQDVEGLEVPHVFHFGSWGDLSLLILSPLSSSPGDDVSAGRAASFDHATLCGRRRHD
jgi:hypothetical protein